MGSISPRAAATPVPMTIRVAWHRPRDAGSLDEEQREEREDAGRRDVHVSRPGQAPAAASDSSRIDSARSTSSDVVTSGGMIRTTFT